MICLKFYSLTFLLLLLLNFNARTQELITGSMGNSDLVLNHPENRLSLYRTTGNTAALLLSEPQNWLKLQLGHDDQSGEFIRQYDPGNFRDWFFRAEGYKILSENQAFWGRVNYRFSKYGDLAFILEPDPYANDPIITADTTVGNFNYDGPEVMVGYNYQPHPKIGLGAEVAYTISQGIKNVFSRARVLHRDVYGKLSSVIILGRNLHLGGFYKYQNVQDQIEIQRSQIDGRDPFIKRFRSENIFWIKVGNFDHYDIFREHQFNLSLQHANSAQTFIQLMQFNYHYHTLEAFEETSQKIPDSDWFADNYSGEYEFRLTGNRWNLGARFGYENFSSFSRHPNLDVLITERNLQKGSAESGILLKLSRLEMAVQPGYQLINDDYSDYQSKIKRNLEERRKTLKFGLNWQFNPIHSLMLGWNFGEVDVNTWSPRYLPEHTLYRVTAGILEKRSGYNLAGHFEYFVREAADFNEKYSGWRLVFATRIMQ